MKRRVGGRPSPAKPADADAAPAPAPDRKRQRPDKKKPAAKGKPSKRSRKDESDSDSDGSSGSESDVQIVDVEAGEDVADVPLSSSRTDLSVSGMEVTEEEAVRAAALAHAAPFPGRVHPLRLRDVRAGDKFFGYVASADEKSAVVELPYNLRGVVDASEVSDEVAAMEESKRPSVAKLLAVGQPVVCAVVGKCRMHADKGESEDEAEEEGSELPVQLRLSLKASLINGGINVESLTVGSVVWCSIHSVEDHGCIVSTGALQAASAFIATADLPDGATAVASPAPKKKKTKTAAVQPAKASSVAVGQPLACVVVKSDVQAKTLVLSARPDALRTAVSRPVAATSVTKTVPLPGSLVDVVARRSFAKGLQHGIGYTFAHGLLSAVAPAPFHPAADAGEAEARLRMRQDALNREATARILYVSSSASVVHVSRRDDVVSLERTRIPDDVTIGVVYHGAKVVAFNVNIGAVVALPIAAPVEAFVPLDAMDEKEGAIAIKFRVGASVDVLVTSWSAVDGCAYASSKSNDVVGRKIDYSNLVVGEILRAKVLSARRGVVTVSLADDVTATCDAAMAFDGALPKKEAQELLLVRKFATGKNVSCRVASVDADERRCTVCLKTPLLAPDAVLPPTSPDALAAGAQVVGVVTKANKDGVTVSFFGFDGFAPVSELSQPGAPRVRDPERIFPVGTIATCKVVSVGPKGVRLAMHKERAEGVAPSEVVSVRIKERSLDGSGFVVDIGTSGETAFIPDTHLSDHPCHVAAIAKSLKPGREIQAVVITTRTKKGHDNKSIKMTYLSAKPAIIRAINEHALPDDAERVAVNEVLTGHIRSVDKDGVTIGFMGQEFSAVAPRALLADNLVADIKSKFEAGQTVRCCVTAVEKDVNRATVTLRQSKCASTDAEFVKTWLADRDSVVVPKLGVDLKWAVSGAVVKAKVHSVKDTVGVVVKFPHAEGVHGFCVAANAKGADAAKGKIVDAVVLDVDVEQGSVDVSLQPELVAACRKATANAMEVDEDDESDRKRMEVVVQVVKDYYVVVSTMENGVSRIAYARGARDYNDHRANPHAAHQPGQRLWATAAGSSAGRSFVSLEAPDMSKAKTLFEQNVKSVGEVAEGMIVRGTVKTVTPQQISVSLGQNILGRVHVSQALDDADAVAGARPFAAFRPGSTICARVVGVRDKVEQTAVTASSLPVSRAGSEDKGRSVKFVELTLRSSAAPVATYETLQPGDLVVSYVHQVTPDAVWVYVGPGVRARVFILDASDNADELVAITSGAVPARLSPGSAVLGVVRAVDAKRRTADLSLLPDKPETPSTGDVIVGRISRIVPHIGLNIQTGAHTYGQAFLTDLDDVVRANALEGFAPEQFVSCYVLSVLPGGRCDLSLRPSLVGHKYIPVRPDAAPETPAQQDIRSATSITAGQVIYGYVHFARASGVYVSVGRHVDARVSPRAICHSRVQAELVDKLFHSGERVAVRVTQVSKSGRINATLLLDGAAEKKNRAERGKAYNARVVEVSDTGCVLRIIGSTTTGFLRADASKDRKPIIGDTLLVYIKSFDKAKRHPARFSIVSPGPKAPQPENKDAHDTEIDERFIALLRKDHEDVSGVSAASDLDADREEGEEAEDDDEAAWEMVQKRVDEGEYAVETAPETTQPPAAKRQKTSVADEEEPAPSVEELEEPGALQVAAGFSWGNAATTRADDDESSDEDEKKAQPKEPKNKAKKEEKRRKEEEIAKREQELAGDKAPETAIEFDRLLLGAPDSSFIWIKYMAFYLSMTEVEKARQVAERALSKINAREEKERENVWVALLNLEHTFGTPSTLSAVLDRALQSANPKRILSQMALIYESADRMADAEDAYRALVKRFSTSVKAWSRYAAFVAKRASMEGGSDETKKLLDRALQSLPKRKHLRAVTKFAQLEFKCGSPERGRTMFEGIIATCPKRIDLWNVYADMELSALARVLEGGVAGRAKEEAVAVPRRLFDRVTSMKLSSKKMQYFFKRWLAFEKQYGTKVSTQRVLHKAQQYIDAKS
eukprot:m51a1_g13931 putative RRP5 (2017) ;mRNA; f:845282-852295